jgi:hypothetical protein
VDTEKGSHVTTLVSVGGSGAGPLVVKADVPVEVEAPKEAIVQMLGLGDDVLELVFTFLHTDLAAVSQACLMWRSICNSSSLWQCLVEYRWGLIAPSSLAGRQLDWKAIYREQFTTWNNWHAGLAAEKNIDCRNIGIQEEGEYFDGGGWLVTGASVGKSCMDVCKVVG